MERETIENYFHQKVSGTDMFLVDVVLKPGNVIHVFIDTPQGITLDECVRLNREFNETFDREKEDYELQVSSPGLDMPLKVDQQLKKYLNKEIQVTFHDGKKTKATLLDFSDAEMILKVIEKKKDEGKKSNKTITMQKMVKRDEVKSIMAVISFK